MDSILQMPGFEAIIFVTHDIDLALIYANRIILIADGALKADGPPLEILSDLELIESCRLVPTSLLKANIARKSMLSSFLRAEALAHL
jgi:ABC-type cobalamin/Fe3+-siderophores transport system ATPase subunit